MSQLGRKSQESPSSQSATAGNCQQSKTKRTTVYLKALQQYVVVKFCMKFFCIPNQIPTWRPWDVQQGLKAKSHDVSVFWLKSADFSFSLFVSLCFILGPDVVRLTQSRRSRPQELPGSRCATVIFFPSFSFSSFYDAFFWAAHADVSVPPCQQEVAVIWRGGSILGSPPQEIWLFSLLILRFGARRLCCSKVANEMWRLLKCPEPCSLGQRRHVKSEADVLEGSLEILGGAAFNPK